MTRRRFLIAATAAAGAAAAGSVAYAYRFGVVRHRAPLPGLRAPLRLAFLSDLHHGRWIHSGSVRAWVDAALAAEPDLVVLGGDLVDTHPGEPVEALLDALAPLRAPLGVFAVWGNHDHRRMGDLAPFRDALGARGVRVLTNASVPVRDDASLAGLDDLRTGAPDLRAALRGLPDEGARLLASHNPDVLPDVPVGAVELTLAGHTHGGQVRIPGVGPVVTSSRYGRRFDMGWVRGPALGYVSRGLGVGLAPIRVACPAELTVMDLVPVGT